MDPEIDRRRAPQSALHEQHDREASGEVPVGRGRKDQKARADDDGGGGKKEGIGPPHHLDEDVIELRRRAFRDGAEPADQQPAQEQQREKRSEGDRERDPPLPYRIVIESLIEEPCRSHSGESRRKS